MRCSFATKMRLERPTAARRAIPPGVSMKSLKRLGVDCVDML